ncbi:MAG: hypothetical protein V8R40_01440 [Dysosmobacter sp.]
MGAVIASSSRRASPVPAGAFACNAFTVGLGEAIACYALGLTAAELVLPRVPALHSTDASRS